MDSGGEKKELMFKDGGWWLGVAGGEKREPVLKHVGIGGIGRWGKEAEVSWYKVRWVDVGGDGEKGSMS